MARRSRGSGDKGTGAPRDAAVQMPPALPRGQHGLSRVGRQKALVLAARHTSFASPLLARAQMGLPSSPFVVPAFARRLRHHTTLPALPAIDPFGGQAGLSGALLRRYETFLSPWWERQPGAALRRGHLYTRMAPASLAHRRRAARADAFEDSGIDATPSTPVDAPVTMEPLALAEAAVRSEPAWEVGWDAPAWEAVYEPLAADAVTAVERAYALPSPLMPAVYRAPLSLPSQRPASDLLVSPLAAALAPSSPATLGEGEGEEAASPIARAPEPHSAHTARAQEWRQRFYGWEQWQPTFMPSGPLPLAVSQEMPDGGGEEGAAGAVERDGFARSDGTPVLPPAPFAPPMTALPGVFGLISSIQRRARDGAGTPAADQRARALAYAGQSSGGPLDATSAAMMRAALGGRFEGVRVHADAAAAQAAAALGAHAFTVGQNVYFAEGAYAPETPAGLALLGHELAHTLQQGSTFAGMRAVPSTPEPVESTGEAIDRATMLPVPSALQQSALQRSALQQSALQQSALPLALAALPSGSSPISSLASVPGLAPSLPFGYGSVSPSDYGSVSSLPGGDVAAPPAFQPGTAAFAGSPAPFPAMIGSGAGMGYPSLPLAAGLAARDGAIQDRSAARAGGGAMPYAPYPLYAGAMTPVTVQLAGPTGLPQAVPGSFLAAMSLSHMASRATPEAQPAGTTGESWGAGAPPMALITAALSPWVSAAARLGGYGASPLGGYGASASPAGAIAGGYGGASTMAAALPGGATSASAMETSSVGWQTQADFAQTPATPQAGEQFTSATISPSIAPHAASFAIPSAEGRIPSPPNEAGMPSLLNEAGMPAAFAERRMPAAGALPSPEATGMFGAAGLAAGTVGARAMAGSALAGQGAVPGGVLQLMRAAMAEQTPSEHGPAASSSLTAMHTGPSFGLATGIGTASVTMRPGMMSSPLVPALEAGAATLPGRTRAGEATAGPMEPLPLSLALAAGSLGISSGIIARQIAGALRLRGGMAPDGGAYAAIAGEAFGSAPLTQAGALTDPSRVPGGTSPQGAVPAQSGQWYPGALRVPDAALPQGTASYQGAMGAGSRGAVDAARGSSNALPAASWQPGVDAPAAGTVRPLDLAGTILARAAGGHATVISPAALAARADLWPGADARARDPLSRPAVLSRAPLAIALTGIAPSIDRGVAAASTAGSFMSSPSATGATLAEPFRPVMRDMLAPVAPVDAASGEAGHGDRAGAAPPSRALLPAAGSVVSGLAALVDGGIGRVARFARVLVSGESADMERASALTPGVSLAADTPALTLTPIAAADRGAAAAMTTGTPMPGALAPDTIMAPAVMPLQRAASEAAPGAGTATTVGIIGRGAALVDALVSRASGVLALAGEVSAPRPALALSFAGGPAAPDASVGSGGSGGPRGAGASMAAGLSRVGALAASIQRKAERGAETPSLQRRVMALERATESSGQPLGGTTREVMRAALGRDVGTVQVHTDAAAARAADVLGARAFALGRSVYFASGAYAPETPAGLALLGHELVHTMQGYGGAQRAAAAGATLDADVEPAHLEAEALRTEQSLLHLFSAGPPSLLATSGAAASDSGSAPHAVQRATSMDAAPSMALFAPAIPIAPAMATGSAAMGSAIGALPSAMTGGLAASAAAFGAPGAIQRVPDGASPLQSNLSSPAAWPRASRGSSLDAALAFNTAAMLPGYAALQRRFDTGVTALVGTSPWVARSAGASLPDVSSATGATIAGGAGNATGLSGGAYGNRTAAGYESYGNAALTGGAPYGDLSPTMLAGLAAGISGGASAGMAMALSSPSSGISVMRAVDGAAQPGGGLLSAAPLDMGMRLMRLSIEAGDVRAVPGASAYAGFAPAASGVYQRAVDGGALGGGSYQSGIGVTTEDAGRHPGARSLDMSLAGAAGTALGIGTGTGTYLGTGTGATLGMGMGTPPVQRDVDRIVQRDVDRIVQRDVDGMRTLANPGLTSALNDGATVDVGLTNAATADHALREQMAGTAEASDMASAWGDSVERTLVSHVDAASGLSGMLQRRVDHSGDGVESLAVDAMPMTQRTTPVVVARSADSGVSQGISSGDSWTGTPGDSWSGTGGGSWPGAMPAPLGASNGAVVQRFVPDTSTASGGQDVKTSAQDTHGATGSGAQAAPNIDELTEQVIRRIKQQLRLDQERMGGYLPDFMR